MNRKFKSIFSFVIVLSMLLGITAAAYPTGDANGDGGVNAADRAYISRYIAKWKGYETLAGGDAADTNGDGNVNALDRAAVSRHVAKWSGYEVFDKDKDKTGSGTALVDSVDVTTGKITFKEKYTTNEYINNSYVIVDAAAKLTLNGNNARVSDLREYDVLHIYTDNLSDPTILKIEAIRNEVWGKAEETGPLSSDWSSWYVIINGEKYEINSEVISIMSPDRDFSVGDMGIFYLDKDNKVAGFKEQNIILENRFGVITDYEYDEITGKTSLTFYTDGSFTTKTLAESVEIDGSTLNIEDGFIDMLDFINGKVSFYGSDAIGIPAIIRFNENWKIEYIDSPVSGMFESRESLHYINKTYESVGSVINDATYNSLSGMINNCYTLSESAPVLTIPSNYDAMNDERAYSYKKASTLESTTTDRYDIALFREETSGYNVSYAVILKQWQKPIYTQLTDSDGAERHDKQMQVVQSVSRIWDMYEDKPTLKVYAYTDGQLVEFEFDPDYANSLNTNYPTANLSYAVENMYFGANLKYPSDDYPMRKNNLIQEGDVIRVRQNEYGQVVFIDFIWMMEEKIFHCDDYGNLTSEVRYRAFDIGFAKSYANSVLEMQHLVDKRQGFYNDTTQQFFFDSNKYPMLTIDDDMFVPNKSASDYSTDVSLWEDDVMETCFPVPATSFKIMTYNGYRNSGSRVNKGSVNDLILAAEKEAPSIVIIQYRSSNPRGMYIINL